MLNESNKSGQSRTPLDRFLLLFSDVRSGEGTDTVLLALNIFLILTAYYVLKPVREALILGQGSAELKSYLSAGQIGLLAIAVPLYGRYAARVPRRRLINRVTAIFAGCLALFYVLAQFDVPLGIVFFMWIGVFNLMIVAQFWSFANDVYTKEEGERLFPIVAFGASLGAVLGAIAAGQLIESLGVYQLLLVGAVLILAAVQITNYVDRRQRRRSERHLSEEQRTSSVSCTCELPDDRAGRDPSKHLVASSHSEATSGAFGLVFANRYLLLIGFLLLLLNWVNTTGEYILGSVIEDAARRAVADGSAQSVERFIGSFYANFFGLVNIVGLVIQLFLVSRIIKFFGVAVGVMILPALALFAYGVLALYPVLAVVRIAKTAENSTDYSLNNTVRNMLFLPTSRAEKYIAKQVIDSLFARTGDVLSALLVFVGTTFLALSATGFAMINIALAAAWLTVACLIGREYRRRFGSD